MAAEEVSVRFTEVHAITLAITPNLTTVTRFKPAHPASIAVGLKAILPDIPELVAIDITLIILAANRSASGDRAIHQDRGDGQSRSAMEEMIADPALVVA